MFHHSLHSRERSRHLSQTCLQALLCLFTLTLLTIFLHGCSVPTGSPGATQATPVQKLELPYDELNQQAEADNIATITFTGLEITGTFRQPYKNHSEFHTTLPSNGDPKLINLLIKHNVKVISQPAQN